MTEINPKTYPIAFGFFGAIAISAGAYGYYFGQNANAWLTVFLLLLGIGLIVASAFLWDREKKRYHTWHFSS